MIVNDNIRLLIFQNNGTNQKFADEIECSKGTVDRMVNGHNFSVDLIDKIARNIPTLNIDWLFTGRGEQYFIEKETLDLKVEEPQGTYETKLRLLKHKNNQLVNENNDLKNKLIELQNLIIKSTQK